MGTLYYGDNLDILRRHLGDDTVDLVYLDPPFNSAQDYNAFFHEKDGMAAASQIKAFEGTWPSPGQMANPRKSLTATTSAASHAATLLTNGPARV